MAVDYSFRDICKKLSVPVDSAYNCASVAANNQPYGAATKYNGLIQI